MLRHYAAIGTRNLTQAQRKLCVRVGRYLAKKGFILHTGAAQGADQTYAESALENGGRVALHLPWRTYEEGWITAMLSKAGPALIDVHILADGDAAAMSSVDELHPAPFKLSSGAVALHARNYRIIHPETVKLVDFVVALPSPSGGGTMQGIRIAKRSGITVVRLDELSPPQVKKKLDSLIGSVAERSKAAVLKTADPRGSGGSNPSASEEYRTFQRRLKKFLEVLPKGSQDTLKLAQLKLANEAIVKGTRCPCCGKYVRVNPRPLNSTMARSLIWLVNASGPNRRWVDWQEESPKKYGSSNQLSTLKYGPEWALVEAKPNDNPKQKSSGWWRPTNRGVDFVNKRLLVRKRVHTYNDTALRFSGPKIDIETALGTKFNYAELMARTYLD